ncbi:uncharacterized protein LOC122260182 [Penaeus japonicus]|uniref:uncharacterized protein LOC122260182 n=1 Tax=Penaeus japonicus TaxID=27405 RepID=UPI001C713541|nr:uncharacterized protein LOC122260182 [Penaeus japonicus]
MEIHNSQRKPNSVKGVLSTDNDPSLGKVPYVRQVGPDRHQATVSNNKETLRIGTRNVRTLFQAGKLENVTQEMSRMKINILRICETRWKHNGDFQTDDYRMLYSGGDRHERGVGIIMDKERAKCVIGHWELSDRVMMVKLKGSPFNSSIILVNALTSDSSEDDIDKFYETIEEAKGQCKSQEIIIVMGDLNAKVGQDQGDGDGIIGKHGLGIRNERGDRWVQWCKRHNQIITNTCFQDHPRRLWTWRSPGGNIKNQIDYITINSRFRNAVKHSKAFPGADCGSDHIPVICKLSKGKLSGSLSKKALVKGANATIPKQEKKNKNKWMTDEIIDMMKERQKIMNRKSLEYKKADRKIKKKCQKNKEAWVSAKCKEIERCKNKDSSSMHKHIKDLIGTKSCSSSGCLIAKDGTVIMEKEEILERWTEYIEDLFHDDRGEKPKVEKNMEGPPTLKSEVRVAIGKMKKNKAPGPDKIVTEMIKALDEFGIDKMTEVINEIYDSGEIPEELSKSIFIALPKKPGAIECELHRTISLMSHIIKIILRIIMERARSRIRPEIGNVQYGFVQDAGPRNAIWMVRMLSERAIEMQKDLFMCFIDYTKAFDKVQHEELLRLLQGLDLDGKDIRLIRNLYWEQKACMRVDNDTSKYTPICRGVRQGCVLSPDLFNLYSEMILRQLEDMPGFILGGHNINNLRYADDTVLIAESRDNLQELLDKVIEESKKKGLTINCKKTECMVVSKKTVKPQCMLHVGTYKIQQVEKFNYLGSLITDDGKCDREIKKRIGMAKDAFQKLGKILKDRKMPTDTKLRVLDCYVNSILTYGCECWTISTQMERRLEAVEMWFLRRIFRISWVDHVSNEAVLRKAGVERMVMKNIQKRQLEFVGHIMRKNKYENLALTGRIEGKRSRGRQRITYLNSLSTWMAGQIPESERSRVMGLEMLKTSKNRELWRSMTAYILNGHGT